MMQGELASRWLSDIESSLEDYRDRDGPGAAVYHLVSGMFAVSFGQATPMTLSSLEGLTDSVLRDVRCHRLTARQAGRRLGAAIAAARIVERTPRRAVV